MSVSWETECHLLYEDIEKQTELIKELRAEVSRLNIAYTNASGQRQHYVEKSLMLSKIILEFSNLAKDCLKIYDARLSAQSAWLLIKHEDLIKELKRNLED